MTVFIISTAFFGICRWVYSLTYQIAAPWSVVRGTTVFTIHIKVSISLTTNMPLFVMQY